MAVNDDQKLRPYRSLGLELKVGGKEALGDCPFCGKEGKFSVLVETGQWRCYVCNVGVANKRTTNRGGNVYTFIRLLWELGRDAAEEPRYQNLARQRGYLNWETLSQWGVVSNPITGEWLVPGYAPDGKLNTLYRYTTDVRSKKMRLFATAELGHQLHGVPLYNPECSTTYLTEGVWDAMALWEALRITKKDVEGYSYTGVVGVSLGPRSNVLATPGCNVFKQEWLPLFAGKKVVLCFDNDHPRINPKMKQELPSPAREGMKSIAMMLASSAEHKPESVRWLRWGEDGYDPDLPDGHDLRDLFTTEPDQEGDGGGSRTLTAKERSKKVWWFMDKVEPIPEDWVGGRTEEAKSEGSLTLQLLPCKDYKTLVSAFSKALDFHEGLDRGLSIMLAVCLSTTANGDQLWITVQGPAACGKSTLCEAVSTAVRWVTAKSTIRGFHSGFKTDNAGKEDHSLIPLVANKTLVTKDGDTLMTSPNLTQILAEARDLYDRTSRTHYRHGLKRDYSGINITWILCGTSSLSELDRSELGQRFIKVIILDRIDDAQEWRILMRKAKQADKAMNSESTGSPETQQDPELTLAYQLTGGYVEYLRSNANELLNSIELPQEVYEECATLARFTAFMRARPSKVQKEKAEREFATRLTSQFVRLTKCLCVVMNKPGPNEEIMRRVRQTALDTSQGRVLKMVTHLYRRGVLGGEPKGISYSLGELEQDVKELLVFLKKIGAVQLFRPRTGPMVQGDPRWRLEQRIVELYEKVIGPDKEELNAAAQEF